MVSMIVFIEGSKLITIPKPQPKGKMLCTSSGHHPAVHVAWPFTVLNQTRRITSDEKHVIPAQLDIVSRLANSGFLSFLTNAYHNYITNPKPKPTTTRTKVRSRWIILKHHPGLYRCGFQRAVNKFLANPVWKGVLAHVGLEDLAGLRIGWRNPAPHIHQQLLISRCKQS